MEIFKENQVNNFELKATKLEDEIIDCVPVEVDKTGYIEVITSPNSISYLTFKVFCIEGIDCLYAIFKTFTNQTDVQFITFLGPFQTSEIYSLSQYPITDVITTGFEIGGLKWRLPYSLDKNNIETLKTYQMNITEDGDLTLFDLKYEYMLNQVESIASTI